VRSRLVAGPAPRWAADYARLYNAPLPNLLGQVDLQRVLLADALARLHAGDPATALDDLEASWTLNATIRARPALIEQLVAVSVTRLQAGVLSSARRGAEIWQARFASFDARSTFVRSLDYEALVLLHLDRAQVATGVGERLTNAFLRPYVRLCQAEVGSRWHESMRQHGDGIAACDRSPAGGPTGLGLGFSWWNRLAPRVVPNLTEALVRLARLEVDLELTERVLVADRLRSRDGLLHSAGEVDASRACPGDGWRSERNADGGTTIAFTRELAWPPSVGAVLPTRFTIPPR